MWHLSFTDEAEHLQRLILLSHLKILKSLPSNAILINEAFLKDLCEIENVAKRVKLCFFIFYLLKMMFWYLAPHSARK